MRPIFAISLLFAITVLPAHAEQLLRGAKIKDDGIVRSRNGVGVKGEPKGEGCAAKRLHGILVCTNGNKDNNCEWQPVNP